MKVEIIETNDGSHTLFAPQFDDIYHSRHGALAESEHIFIQNGLTNCKAQVVNIFEVGFGTGLNALLSQIYAESKNISINYHSIELYPVSEDIISKINYPQWIGSRDKFEKLHIAKWGENVILSSHFSIHKIHASILDVVLQLSDIDVIFFDAFSPEKQPEIWTKEVFAKMFEILAIRGILVTYCSKSYVRRNMEQVGFQITKLPGPHGKRDMVLAEKRLKADLI
jgi:tRNA U34 5-methylaminomethyl-2-thiouridine-forming methyltransferase MnmC